ncbi:hypothetical protein AB0H79_09755 [Micrococcus luteus]|uniref:hypothetical protein n=1 Tax=Micrococcus luteus TaxID=1270 RepID=UPI0033DB313C
MKTTYKTAAAAVQAAVRAERTAEEMERQAQDAQARIAAMESESVDALVADPGQAQAITTAIDGQTRLVAAYRAKAAEAEVAQAHIDKLLTALEEYAGASFEVAPASRDPFTGEPTSWPSTVAEDLRDEGTLLRVQASSSRYHAEHGSALRTAEDLNALDGIRLGMYDTAGGLLSPSAHWSPLLRAIDAGTALTGED